MHWRTKQSWRINVLKNDTFLKIPEDKAGYFLMKRVVYSCLLSVIRIT